MSAEVDWLRCKQRSRKADKAIRDPRFKVGIEKGEGRL